MVIWIITHVLQDWRWRWSGAEIGKILTLMASHFKNYNWTKCKDSLTIFKIEIFLTLFPAFSLPKEATDEIYHLFKSSLRFNIPRMGERCAEWVHTIRITWIKEIQSWCKSSSEAPVSSLWREVHNCQNKNIVSFLPTSPTSYNFPSRNGRMEWPIVVNFYSNRVNIQNETYHQHWLTLEKQFITGALALIIYLNIPRRQRFLS